MVSAGGVIHATAVELHGETSEQAAARVRGIGDTLARVLREATRAGVTPAAAARALARRRLDTAGRAPGR
ncbi:hypothetical protein [Allostreptomyces psammosilenae]|uniref:Glutamate dehydrogenase/leucine dehydrogenase n=1 Tax=Allostreptomyces psammosilenae TaxID=1892865 RepID=A0A852ZT18_9ACTN|nr:hypothetical protein [Allostreptomyces psammosilenae]NYI04667.1 glutamate dehydrogenase/leucine dehydrogenase [Allostreptomyces psammosilenae]